MAGLHTFRVHMRHPLHGGGDGNNLLQKIPDIGGVIASIPVDMQVATAVVGLKSVNDHN